MFDLFYDGFDFGLIYQYFSKSLAILAQILELLMFFLLKSTLCSLQVPSPRPSPSLVLLPR